MRLNHNKISCIKLVHLLYLCLYKVHRMAVSEGLFRTARRFKVNCYNAVLDVMKYVTIL